METVVITGASDGVGAAAAAQLKVKGYNVVIVGRSPVKTEALARDLDVSFHIADFSRLDDVRRLAAELDRHDRIDVLANNAGGIMGPRQVTIDGYEKTFQVNHLAPFLLTRLLLPKLIASKAKVIQTASNAPNFFKSELFDATDLNCERSYAPETAYGLAKLENILFTRELARRHGKDGISAVAFHPGIVRSNFASETTHFVRFIYRAPLKYLITISPKVAAREFVDLVEGKPGVDWQPGEIYAKGKPMRLKFKDESGETARRLWERSEQMLKSREFS